MSEPLDEGRGGEPRRTGLADHIRLLQQSERSSFHMPGHKGPKGAPPSARALLGDLVFAADLSELSGFDYLHGPTSALFAAQERASQVFGADRSWFLVNGATVGNIAAITSTVGEGEEILVARDSHRSVYAGLALSGAKPVYLAPQRNARLDGLYGVSVDDVRSALMSHRDLRAIHITSPSYYGFCSPVGEIAELAHERDLPLLVDEAHGAHLYFNDTLPRPALPQGADLVVQSPHKSLGSLTQSSLLHLKGDRVAATKIEAYLSMLQSSSPSALLLVSLDAAVEEMVIRGKSRWAEAIEIAGGLRHTVEEMGHLYAYGAEIVGTPGIDDYDPTKLVVDVKGLHMTGFAAARFLREQCNINPEFSDLRRMVFSLTFADSPESATLLSESLRRLESADRPRFDRSSLISLWPASSPIARCTPREAQQRHETLPTPLGEAIGRTSAEMIVPYPPGVPLLIPGEVIEAETLESLQQLLSAGCRIVGLSDRSATTLRVLI